MYYLGREYDRGASMIEQAVALNPNLAAAWSCRGFVALMCCDPERAIKSFGRLIRLSPLDPSRIWAWNGSSFAHFHLGRYEEGRALAMKSIQFVTNAHTLAAYIVNAVRVGRAAEAREAVAQLLKLEPDFRASYAKELFPARLPEERDRITSALKDAGLPD
jgi:tetratricopeptide (TPR) repeat protein